MPLHVFVVLSFDFITVVEVKKKKNDFFYTCTNISLTLNLSSRSNGKAFVSGAVGLRFKSWAQPNLIQSRQRLATSAAFFEMSCVFSQRQ